MITRAATERFWSKVQRQGPDECWPWIAGRSTNGGYGQFWLAGAQVKATHVALELDGRPRPEGMFALHRCDNPPCCNPAHLEWGTPAENSAQMVARARSDRKCTDTSHDWGRSRQGCRTCAAERVRQKVRCECGSLVTRVNLNDHRQRRRHLWLMGEVPTCRVPGPCRRDPTHRPHEPGRRCLDCQNEYQRTRKSKTARLVLDAVLGGTP